MRVHFKPMAAVAALFLAAAALLSLAAPSRRRIAVLLDAEEPVCLQTKGLMQILHEAAASHQQQV